MRVWSCSSSLPTRSRVRRGHGYASSQWNSTKRWPKPIASWTLYSSVAASWSFVSADQISRSDGKTQSSAKADLRSRTNRRTSVTVSLSGRPFTLSSSSSSTNGSSRSTAFSSAVLNVSAVPFVLVLLWVNSLCTGMRLRALEPSCMVFAWREIRPVTRHLSDTRTVN
jgi:hypothetical protein